MRMHTPPRATSPVTKPASRPSPPAPACSTPAPHNLLASILAGRLGCDLPVEVLQNVGHLPGEDTFGVLSDRRGDRHHRLDSKHVLDPRAAAAAAGRRLAAAIAGVLQVLGRGRDVPPALEVAHEAGFDEAEHQGARLGVLGDAEVDVEAA